jgi:hypothetical protein
LDRWWAKRKNDVNTKCSFINPSDIIEIMTFAHNPPPYGFKFSISPFHLLTIPFC